MENLKDRLRFGSKIYRSSAGFMLAIFFCALLIRILFNVLILDISRPFEGDESIYFERAIDFINGDWIGSSQRPPLLGTILVPSFLIFGDSLEIGRFVNILISSASCPAIYALGCTLLKSENSSKLGAIIWTLYPPSIWYAGALLTESLSALLIILVLTMLLKTVRSTSLKDGVILGILVGLLALNRSLYLMVFIPVLLFLFACIRPRIVTNLKPLNLTKRNLGVTLLVLVTYVVVVSPWVVHNYIALGKFIPHSTQGGQVLMYSNEKIKNDRIQEGSYIKNLETFHKTLGNSTSDEFQADSIKRNIAMRSIKNDWNYLPKPIVNRFKNFWSSRPDPYDNSWTLNDTIMASIWVPILFFFILGVFQNRLMFNLPVVILISYTCVLVLPFWGTPRFRYPIDPLIVLMGSSGMLTFYSLSRVNSLKRIHFSR
tara:strand:- start:354 stop:1643 length:1290 start_codon:yes stop_codon:yes gene_type:complete